MITSTCSVVVSDGLSTAELDGELVILDVNSGHYFGLNSVGAAIFELIKHPRQVDELVEALHAQYQVEPERLKQDVLAFLNQMEEKALIRVARESNSHVPQPSTAG